MNSDSQQARTERYEEISGDAKYLYEGMDDEKAQQIGRELLQASGGLKLDHRQGRMIIGDCAVQLRLCPDFDADPNESYTEFRYEFLDDHAEGWYIHGEPPYLTLSWERHEIEECDS